MQQSLKKKPSIYLAVYISHMQTRDIRRSMNRAFYNLSRPKSDCLVGRTHERVDLVSGHKKINLVERRKMHMRLKVSQRNE